jgi:hypothetical protein
MVEFKAGQLAKEYDKINHNLISVYLLLTAPGKNGFEALCVFESVIGAGGELFNIPGETCRFAVSLFNPGDSYWKIDNVKINHSELRW